MTRELTEEINKSQGEELRLPCAGDCGSKTYHDVVVSVDVVGSDGDKYHSVDWRDDYQIIKCRGCGALSFRNQYSNSEEYDVDAEGELYYIVHEELYPSRIEGRKDLGFDAIYIPADISRIYKETIQALNGQSPVLAGIGLRALIETVCKEKEAQGVNLVQKIDDLVEKQILTPEGARILHRIRSLGNEAAHEVKPHNEESLGLAMTVVEHLLQDVYILPAKAEQVFRN